MIQRDGSCNLPGAGHQFKRDAYTIPDMTLDQVIVMKVCIQIGMELEKSNKNTLFIKRELYR